MPRLRSHTHTHTHTNTRSFVDPQNLILYFKIGTWANNSPYQTIINAAEPADNLEVSRLTPLLL